MNAPRDLIPIPLLSRELLALTGLTGPGYRRLVQLASDAAIPAIKGPNGRWYCPRDRLVEVADLLTAMGLMRLAPTRLRLAALREDAA